MERTIKYNPKVTVRGVAYDKGNNVLSKGMFIVQRDKNNKLTLKNTTSNKTITVPKEQFDSGDTIPRRIPSNKSKNTKDKCPTSETLTQDKMDQLKRESERKKKEEEERKKTPIFHETKAPIVTYEQKHEIINLIRAGIKNIWMVGPSGCGKTTIASEIARELRKPFYMVSCGQGTSSSEFIGYKYPKRESTPFSKYYTMPSILVLDEFAALEANVAQVVNSALANNLIETTTGSAHRHRDCIIIATSNTFGTGADTMYVANNVLDASTLDRFTGGIVKIDYSEEYEKRFDKEVRDHVKTLRRFIDSNYIRRIASTRSMIQGERLKKAKFQDWRDKLTISWTDDEKEQFKEFIAQEKQEKIDAERKRLASIQEDTSIQEDNRTKKRMKEWVVETTKKPTKE